MSIGVVGAYLFKFSLNNNNDFIDEPDLISFSIHEQAGNLLPTFELNFLTDDETIFPLLNEGNDLQVSFGSGYNDLVTIPLATSKVQSVPSGSAKRQITVMGLYSAIPYITNPNMQITNVQSGISTIIQIAGKSFNVQSNIQSSTDSQSWIQHTQSDKSFIDDIWLHCNLPNSFPALGISSQGNFILKDIKTDLKNPYRYRFTQIVKNSNDIYFDGDPVLTSNTGFINSWVGYGREKIIQNVDKGTDSTEQVIPKPVMALTSQLAKAAGINSVFDGIGIQNSNIDTNYWNSYLNNLTYLGMFGALDVTVSFQNKFIPIQILDQINFKDQKIDQQYPTTSDYNTGIYYVSKISRNVGNKAFNTVVSFSRESFNGIQVGL
jgi:hypothetical protein